MKFLSKHPLLVTRCAADAWRDARSFGDQVEAYDVLDGLEPYRVGVNAVTLDGLRLLAFQTTGHRVRFVDEATLGVIVPEAGRLLLEDGRGLADVQRDAAALVPPGRRTTTLPGPYAGLGLRVPLSRLAAHAALNAEDGWQAGGDWPLRPAPGLVQALRDVVQEMDAPDAPDPASCAGRGMARRLLDLLLEQVSSDAPASAGLIHIRRAEAALRERLPEAVSIVGLAGELGISTRALQLGFRRHRGTTPRDFLATCRLEAVRDRLCQARQGETVTGIAFECGVMHLGRFAAQYRRHYGEAPSATLARAHRRA